MTTELLPARPYVSVHLLLMQDDRLLLMKRQNSVDHNGKYVFPAGKVDANETPSQAVIREANEEIGIVLDAHHVKPLGVIYRTTYPYKDEKLDVVEFFFLATAWQNAPVIKEPHKCSELAFFPTNQLPDDVSESVGTFLKEQGGKLIEISAEDWVDYRSTTMTSF